MTDSEQIANLQSELAEAKAECDELQRTFDLIWEADMRGIAMWRAEDPERRELVSPDKAKMVCWLLEQLDTLRAENDELLIGQAADVAIGEAVSRSAKDMNGIIREVATYLGISNGGKFPTRTQIMNRATELQAAEQHNAKLVEAVRLYECRCSFGMGTLTTWTHTAECVAMQSAMKD